MPFRWTHELVENMKSMRDAGYSASEIACALVDSESVRTTRNAVLGKLFRLGLCTNREHCDPRIFTNHRHRNNPKKASAPPTERKKNFRGYMASTPLPIEVVIEILPEPEPPQASAVRLLELAPDGCRYPVGDGVPQLFCNAKKTDGAYCRHHHRMSYRKPLSVSEKERRRRHYQSLKNISKLESGYAQSGVSKYVIDEEAA